MDQVFKALADSGRRALLDQLHQHNGQTLTQLCQHLRMTRQGITKHLGLLIKADLVVPLWRGREKRHYLNPAPLRQVSKRWIEKYEAACLGALSDLDHALEETGPDTTEQTGRPA
jgi:DNA-binding transcriptional ArsR family regulator